jgi:hypothetical protein
MIEHVTDDARGKDWHLMLGDSCERLTEITTDSIGLSVYSPPFANLYTYSDSPRDLGNSSGIEEFFQHYRFIIDQVLRVTMPGRISAVHCQQLTTTKATHGETGIRDFRGEIIQAHVDAGWIFHGEVTIDKCPQAQAIRTKSQALMFVTLNKDSSKTRPALADYLLLFRKPGENPAAIENDVDNETWIEWARPIWRGIKETNTLNARAAKSEKDERHICPLQLDLIERAIRLWSNQGETVLSPFAGIGSEGVEAVRLGRGFVGCELKPDYWRCALQNITAAEELADRPTLLAETEGAA